MHPSTIAAILAFTAGMPASAAPTRGRVPTFENVVSVVPSLDEILKEARKPGLAVRASRGSRFGKAFEGVGDAIGAVSDVLTIGQAAQGSQPNAKREAQRLKEFCAKTGLKTGFCQPPGILSVDKSIHKRDPLIELPSTNALAAREAGRGRRFGNAAEGVVDGIGAIGDLINIGGAVQGQQKRDAQRGRNFGKFIKGFGEGVGTFGDLINIGGAVQGQQKRDAQRGRNFGKFLKGVGEGVGTFGDLINIGGAVQGQQKRDAQRGRNFGKFLKGVGEGVGTFGDLVNIGGVIGGQPAQKREEETQLSEKRDAQRSKSRILGNLVEGVAGAIGGASDIITIGGAVQGQGQPAQKREAQRTPQLARCDALGFDCEDELDQDLLIPGGKTLPGRGRTQPGVFGSITGIN